MAGTTLVTHNSLFHHPFSQDQVDCGRLHREQSFWLTIRASSVWRCLWERSFARSSKALFYSIYKFRWNPMSIKISLHWLYKFSCLWLLWKSLPGRTKRWDNDCNKKITAWRPTEIMMGTAIGDNLTLQKGQTQTFSGRWESRWTS